MAVEKFEDLVAWQKARELTHQIYTITRQGEFAKDFGLRDQIRRAAVSVMSNIAEGFERGSRPEFHHYLVIGKGSCAEVRSQLFVALDAGYVPESDFKSVMAMAAEVSRIIGGLRSSVDPKNKR